MNQLIKLFFLFLLIIANAKAGAQVKDTAKKIDAAAKAAVNLPPVSNRFFPFEAITDSLIARIDLKEARVQRYYTPLFQKYLYAGNIHTWEDMMEELVSAKDPDFSVMNSLDFDSDTDVVILKAKNKEELEKYLTIVHATFSSISRLEAFIKTVDPTHIDDGSHQSDGDQ